MAALYATLTKMAGPLDSEQLYELCLRALLGSDGEWDEGNCDRQQILTRLIVVLCWYLEDEYLRGGPEPNVLRFDAAERVYTRVYRENYRGSEIATSWPDALPCDDIVVYPRELVARIALAMADRDNAEALALRRYYAQHQEQGR